MEREITLLLLAGGSGSRLGGNVPKQFIKVQGKMIIERCIDSIIKCEKISEIQIVIDRNREEFEDLKKYCQDITKRCGITFGFSRPGSSRTSSIFNGLCDIGRTHKEDDIVIIHDSARPLVSGKLLEKCIDTLAHYDGVMPTLPVKDTMYYYDKSNRKLTLLNRNSLLIGQSPEAFYLGKYINCYDGLREEDMMNISGTSEIAIKNGLNVGIIDGEEDNFKITTVNDLERYENILQKKDKQYDI